MKSKEKINQLKNCINDNLFPLMTNDYIYLDLPYYPNIGDHLIWEGTKNFLRQLPYKCLYATSKECYCPPHINKNVIILLHGGGNWGTLYPEHHQFRKKIIQSFPNNRIIILPQTIYYENIELLEEDKNFFNQYSNITICARDIESYELLKKNFINDILLVPDMAFFIDLTHIPLKTNHCDLYMKRRDKELKIIDESHIPHDVEVHDWPSFEKDIFKIRINDYIFGPLKVIIEPFSIRISKKIRDLKWKLNHRIYINEGVDFINKYEKVYTTRLHGMILSILLNKNIYIVDNSYGKLSCFYKTWLYDLDTINI